MANPPVEAKVKATTTVVTILGALLALANWVNDSGLLGSLPAWLQAVVVTAGPGAATFYAGWKTKHTPRGPSAS